jgi:hypothetical protein
MLLSSFLIANIMCRGEIRVFLLSHEEFPSRLKTSTVSYSRTAAKKTGAPAPILSPYLPSFKNR